MPPARPNSKHPLDRPARERSLRHDTEGAVYVEFLIVFIPFFVMVLGMMQIALMYAAHLAVQHAAATAVRAAIVVFPDCEARYDGAPKNDVNGGGRGDDPAAILTSVFGAGGGGGFPGLGGGGGSGGARLAAVRFAANLPLVAASPSLSELEGDLDPSRQNLLAAVGGGGSPAARLALGALGYNNVAVAINFPNMPGSASATFQTRFDSRQQLTARVTYLFHCGVPIVSAMACDDAPQIFSGIPLRQTAALARAISAGRVSPGELRELENARRYASERLSRANHALLNRELEATGVGAGLSSAFLFLTRGNFSVLRAEATLPLQGHESPSIGGECFNVRR